MMVLRNSDTKYLLLEGIAGLLHKEAGDLDSFIATTPEQLLIKQAVELRCAILPEKHLFFSKRLWFFVFNCRI